MVLILHWQGVLYSSPAVCQSVLSKITSESGPYDYIFKPFCKNQEPESEIRNCFIFGHSINFNSRMNALLHNSLYCLA